MKILICVVLNTNQDEFIFFLQIESPTAIGSACFDPRFIGGDGIVFYFHGSRNQHFGLVSDPNLQINAHFIGLRPAGRPRDYTWIQALGIITETWSDEEDHLLFSRDGRALVIPESHLSEWNSSDNSIAVERTANRNSITVTPVLCNLNNVMESSMLQLVKEKGGGRKFMIAFKDVLVF
ncbi:hypothetical protein ACLOJK_020658 [Asimina triloba]